MKRKLLLISLLLLLSFTLVSCSSSTSTEDKMSQIQGSWKSDTNNVVDVFTFNDDGTYKEAIEITSGTGDVIETDTTGTYTVENDTLVLTADTVTAEEGQATEELDEQEITKYTFKIQNDELILEDSNGYTLVFTKQ